MSARSTPARRRARGPDRAAALTVRSADCDTFERVADVVGRAEHVDGATRQILRPVLGGQHAGPTPVRHHAAVEQVERIGDHPRRQHVVDGDRIAVLRHRVEPGVAAGGDGDLGQLLGRRPVLSHVARRRQRVRADERVPPQSVPGLRRGHRPASAASDLATHGRQLRAAVGHEHDLAGAGLDRPGRVLDVHLERRAADVGLVEPPREDAQVLADADAVHREVRRRWRSRRRRRTPVRRRRAPARPPARAPPAPPIRAGAG